MTALVCALVLLAATAAVLSGCGTEVITVPGTGVLNTVTASGEGKEATAPDTAEMTFGATAQGAEPKPTLAEASEKADAILATIKQVGIPDTDIQTTGVNLYPQYDYTQGRTPSITGYQASVQVRVTLKDITKIGDTIDAAVEAGATDISGPMWTLSENAEARSVAIEKAVADAKARAEVMAQAAGKSVGEVISLGEAGVSVPIVYGDFSRTAADGAAAPEIAPGTLEVVAHITVVYELK
jgi:hypothetical protein